MTNTSFDRRKAQELGQRADYAYRMDKYDEAIELFAQARNADRPERAEKYNRRIEQTRRTRRLAWPCHCDRSLKGTFPGMHFAECSYHRRYPDDWEPCERPSRQAP